ARRRPALGPRRLADRARARLAPARLARRRPRPNVGVDEGSARRVANLIGAMDAPLLAPDALIRPWRTATLVASLVAALELVLLIGLAMVLLAKPLSHAMQRHATAAAVAPDEKHAAAIVHRVEKITLPKLTRTDTGVFVL